VSEPLTEPDEPVRDGVRPREVSGTPGHPVVGALSPSRAGDFLSCGLLYRFRTIDRLPERPGLAAFRGTLVHEVLDRLYDLPAPERTVDEAGRILALALSDLLEDEPEAAFALVEDADWPADEPPTVPEAATDQLLADATVLLDRYFVLEDPRGIEPTHREQLVEVALDPDLLLRGYVDRMDETDGRLRVVDYKTGRAPGQQWEQQAMFQLRFYALVVHRATGRIPGRLQLLYLGNGEVLTYQPDEDDLDRFERKLHAIWKAITRAADTGDWRPNRSARCKWCSFQQMCPEFGGTPPPLPAMPVSESSTTLVG
jgi:putative RecB family exonuclease